VIEGKDVLDKVEEIARALMANVAVTLALNEVARHGWAIWDRMQEKRAAKRRLKLLKRKAKCSK
jgi:hypothetical protein